MLPSISSLICMVAVVYFPKGTYLVSDTLVLWAFTQLRGDTLFRPTLVLKQNSAGFDNSMLLKPILATSGGYNKSVSFPWYNDSFAANCIFYNEIHSLTINVSSGNPGAVGVFWDVAQQTSLRELEINLGDSRSGGAAVGVDVCTAQGYATPPAAGIGGGGTVEDVSVNGGSFGIRVQSSQYTFRGLRLAGQSQAAIGLGSLVESFAFVDTIVSNASSVLVVIDGGRIDTDASTVLFVDAIFQNIAGPSAFALPDLGFPLLLENVTFLGDSVPSAFVAAGNKTWLDTARTFIPRWAGWEGGSGNNGIFVAGKNITQGQAFLPFDRTAALPSRPRPWFNTLAKPPCNAVADCGLKGDNVTDDTAALQACVAGCQAIFLPDGVYKLSDTVTLSSDTILVGEALSVLFLTADAPGFANSSAPKPVIDTPADSAGAVLLCELSIQSGAGNLGATLLRWRVGPASGMWDVHLNISDNVNIGLHVSDYGAGVINNMWVS